MDEFVVTALAARISAIKTAEFFAERGRGADFEAFDQIMNRKGGQPPSPDDTL